jgi:hypothetical protein
MKMPLTLFVGSSSPNAHKNLARQIVTMNNLDITALTLAQQCHAAALEHMKDWL